MRKNLFCNNSLCSASPILPLFCPSAVGDCCVGLHQDIMKNCIHIMYLFSFLSVAFGIIFVKVRLHQISTLHAFLPSYCIDFAYALCQVLVSNQEDLSTQPSACAKSVQYYSEKAWKKAPISLLNTPLRDKQCIGLSFVKFVPGESKKYTRLEGFGIKSKWPIFKTNVLTRQLKANLDEKMSFGKIIHL